jgi:tetratricopeptide (TPR) repeat protein
VVLPAIDPEKAIAITEKGIANNPGEWRLYHYLGFINWRLDRYDKAAEAYEKGAEVAGAPAFMQLMAVRMRTKGGSRETAREIYREMLEGAHDKQVRESAELQLLRLDSLDEIDAMSAILSAFQAQYGRCAGAWSDIFPKLLALKLPSGRPLNLAKSGVPVDPTGTEYLLTNTEAVCQIEIDGQKSKIPRQ